MEGGTFSSKSSNWYYEGFHKAPEYSFNRELIMFPPQSEAYVMLKVTEGQLEYETKHFLTKAAKRDRELWSKLNAESTLGWHPMFESIPGGLEEWEIITPPKKKRQKPNKRSAGSELTVDKLK
eukprot:gene10481-12245_t